MRILLTNDDGITAPGLHALYHRLKHVAEVTVVAPEAERSAVGHAITLADPLRVKPVRAERGFSGHALNGTPADCVKIAVRALLDRPPDLVISGINAGANVGTNVLYSGTVSAATEAALLGLPALAVSMPGSPRHWATGAAAAERLAMLVLERGLPPGVSLNVNVPDLAVRQVKGIRVSCMGRCRVLEWFDRRTDPSGRVYYWQAAEMLTERGKAGDSTDDWMLDNGYVSVTPLYPDLTAHGFLGELGTWGLGSLKL